MAVVFTVGGVAKKVQPGWRVPLAINGRSTLTAGLLSADASYRPALDEVVTVTDDGTAIFGGLITEALEGGLGGYGVEPIVTRITANDYNLLAELRHVTETIPAGTLKAALTQVLPYFQGVTLDPAQVDGPALPKLTYADTRGDKVLNDFSLHSGGFMRRIDSNPALRMFLPGTIAAPFNIIEGPGCKADGDIRVNPQRQGYANRVIVRSASLRAMAEDTDAQDPVTGVGRIYEMVVAADDNATQEALDSTAATMLAKALVQRREVRYRTRTPGLLPGQTQTITAPKRNVDNTFLIREIVVLGLNGERAAYDVTAVEGTTYQDGWREDMRRMVGSTVVAVGGAGSTPLQQRFAYPLGGTGTDAAVPSDGVDGWVPASGGNAAHGTSPFVAQINTEARGTRAATVTGRLKADDAGVGVKARLYDVSNGLVLPGESAVVTNTEWETVTFGTTLTAGNFFHELQLWSATVGAWVRAGGFYVE